MSRILCLLGGLFLVSVCLGSQVGRHVRATPKRSSTVVECVFIDGFFKGNGFIYEINQDPITIRLLKAFEISDSGVKSNFDENADMKLISNENQVISFADTRLQEEEGIIYLERLDLNAMTSTTLTIEQINGSEKIVETNSSKCRTISPWWIALLVFTDMSIHTVDTIDRHQSIGNKAFILTGFLSWALQHLLVFVVVMTVMIMVLPFRDDEQCVMRLSSGI